MRRHRLMFRQILRETLLYPLVGPPGEPIPTCESPRPPPIRRLAAASLVGCMRWVVLGNGVQDRLFALVFAEGTWMWDNGPAGNSTARVDVRVSREQRLRAS